MEPLPVGHLPKGVRSRFVEDVNGLRLHILEAGFETGGRPCLLLLHGFPELAYSWRKVIGPLAAQGYHVIVPDQRGYGRTTGWDGAYDGDLGSYRMLNLVGDAIGLVAALGWREVAAVIGHDFGSPVAAWCALLRPDVFRSVALMSAPFPGPPSLSFDTDRSPPAPGRPFLEALDAGLAALARPRKHYQAYYSTHEAADDMALCPQGIHAFLRAYYHVKSADWAANQPYPLTAWSPEELAKLPTYYVMDLGRGMAETAAAEAPSADEIAACAWLSEAGLAVYAGEFARTGFQGGLNWYRAQREARFAAELQVFSGRAIEVPSCFIAGASDWGVHQSPGAFARMQETGCTDMRACRLVEGAGHWVQQEQPEAVVDILRRFLAALP
ncbi:MAG TPA: alpha/beta hydrolase [Caulobacteraceae bacterium]|nr:alpha/beta hydrolase [Caulobacteraceae bacterium]